ncbi:penicillin-binding protein 1A [Hydrogenothermus marinus]|uniref:penicillin-binding protein 1A n=1 Tax=Hydrogenothermus marinus TaxID=133270 RepID=UPI001B8854A8|nr:PBP1A family penicillin-binding protein [Hydrogenothermus marinus]
MLLVISIFLYFLYLTFTLPDIKKLENFQPSQATRIYDYKGKLLSEIYLQKRIYVPIEKIPDFVKKAFIATEDKSFYTNIGIDFEAILRALINDIKAGHIVEGGSTISQQLIKNLFLTPKRTINRKIREIILAIKLNMIYPKDKILELYLNEIYLGHGAYGIEAASETYFGKHVWQLNICEAAVLAGLPKAPSKYDPFKNIEEATYRRDVVINNMLKEGYIDEDTAEKCKSEPINLNYDKPEKIYDYSVEAVKKWLVDRYGYEALTKGGYKVYTTIDKDLQMNASEIMKNNIELLQDKFGIRTLTKQEIETLLNQYKKQKKIKRLKEGNIYIGLVSDIKKNKVKILLPNFEGYFNYKKTKYFHKGMPVYVRYKGGNQFEFVPYLEGALVAIDQKTGEIRALVGGYDIKKSQFNRALYAKRQTGSSFKPIVYLDALMNGYTQVSVLKDEPISFWDPDRYEEWIPENFYKKFYGDVSLRYALVHSLNVASVYLYDKLNSEEVINLAYKLGIKTELPNVKSLVLGTADISPLEMATVYATFANYGKKCEPFLIKKIENSKGEVIYENKPNCQQVVPEDIDAVLIDMLEGVIKEGTGKQANVLGLPLAGKTGTTDEYSDGWFIGFSPYITTAVWVGYDIKKKIGWKATGARTALPIWIDFMATAHANIDKVEDFKFPDDTAYYPINEKTFSLSDGICDYKKELFIIGTEPEYDCEGNFRFYIPDKFLTFLNEDIPEFKIKQVENGN